MSDVSYRLARMFQTALRWRHFHVVLLSGVLLLLLLAFSDLSRLHRLLVLHSDATPLCICFALRSYSSCRSSSSLPPPTLLSVSASVDEEGKKVMSIGVFDIFDSPIVCVVAMVTRARERTTEMDCADACMSMCVVALDSLTALSSRGEAWCCCCCCCCVVSK